MPTKIEAYTTLAAQTAAKITTDFTSWTAFLNLAARLYKYKFSEQLLIFAQRPTATACAEYSVWTQKMRRYVKRAAKGIAVVREVAGVPTLRYLFDIADTGSADGKYYLYSWHIDDEFTPVVTAALEQYFLVPIDDRGLAVQLATIAANLAAKYWDIYKDTLPSAIKGSTLKKRNRAYKKAFLDASTASITYTLLARCGLEPDQLFDEGDFVHVFQCDTPDSVMALGDAVSQCSEMVLRTIEHNIKQYLRDKQAGQDVRPASPSPEPGEPAAA